MTPARQGTLLFRVPVDRTVLFDTPPPLHFVEAENQRPQAFRVLDVFDQTLRVAGHLLIETADGLLLFVADGRLSVQPGAGSGQEIAALPEGPVQAALAGLAPLRALLDVGRGDLTERRLALVDDEGKTVARVALFDLAPAGGDGAMLAMLRSLRGYGGAFDALTRHLTGLGATAEEPTVALFTLLCPDATPYRAKPDIALFRDEDAYQAATDIICAHLAVARQNEDGVIADHDTEFLHDYRISLRKVRSVLSLFRGVFAAEDTAELKAAFSDLMGRTGRLRDLDVYLLDRQHYFDLLPDSLHDGLELAFDIFAAERTEAQAELAACFQSPAYAAAMDALAARFATDAGPAPGPNSEQHAHDFACQLIWKRYRRVCKIARAIDDATPDENLHELRIHCKKLRYLMGFFGPLYPVEKFRGLIKPLKRLQDTLGLFNDYSVQQLALQEFILNHASRGRKQDLIMAKSIGALIAILHQRQVVARADVVSRFRHFDDRSVQRSFQRLFADRGDRS